MVGSPVTSRRIVEGGTAMASETARTTRRHFLRSAAITAGAAATVPIFAAPARAQRPRLVYWCYA